MQPLEAVAGDEYGLDANPSTIGQELDQVQAADRCGVLVLAPDRLASMLISMWKPPQPEAPGTCRCLERHTAR